MLLLLGLGVVELGGDWFGLVLVLVLLILMGLRLGMELRVLLLDFYL